MPKLSSSALGSKRKLPPNPSPELLRQLRAEEESAPPPAKRSKNVTMEEVDDEDSSMNVDRVDFAPGGDADYFAEEDDEGRFFGGGLTSEQKEILNIFDSAGGEGIHGEVCIFITKILN